MNLIWIILILVCGFKIGLNDINSFNSITISVGEDVLIMIIPIITSACFFNGWLNVAVKCGIINQLTNLFYPIFTWIFPELKKENKAMGYIISNIVMNMIGLGSAATSSGLMAMKELDKLNSHSEIASKSMKTFIIMNTAGITLFGTTVASLRIKYGSLTPFDHLPYAFVASIITLITVLFIDRILNNE